MFSAELLPSALVVPVVSEMFVTDPSGLVFVAAVFELFVWFNAFDVVLVVAESCPAVAEVDACCC